MDAQASPTAEAFKDTGREVLRILNEPGDAPTTIERVIALFKTRLDFDAVGVRLQEGDDFPYLRQMGFSDDFLRTENSLLARSADGGACKNPDGSVSLECTCGLVISGRTDPASPLFTPGGSCWTSDSSPLLHLPADQDPRLHPRNRCVHQGFASVALIPIRNEKRIVGLLQLNDRRKGRFSLATVEILEDIAAHIGTALMRKQAETALQQAYADMEQRVAERTQELQLRNDALRAEITERERVESALRENEERYRVLFERANDGILLLSTDGRILATNESFARMHGYSAQEIPYRTLSDLDTPDSAKKAPARLQRLIAGEALSFEVEHFHRNGRIVRLEVSASQVAYGGKTCIQCFHRDVTEGRQADAILQARLRLSDYAFGHSLDELLTRTLDEAEALTASTIGFFHFVEADQRTLSLQTWSTNTLQHMCTAEGKGQHYSADVAGVWVDALRERRTVVHNDYANLPHRKGLPPGHAPVVRQLVVPVLRSGKVVALLGVGNKPGDYGAPDIESVTQLAELAWDIVQSKRADDALKRSELLLRTTQQLTHIGGWEWDIEKQMMFWTDETYRLHDYDPQEFEPGNQSHIERSLNCYLPEDRPAVLAAFQRCAEEGHPYELEVRFTTAKGRKLWVRTAAERITSPGRGPRVIGFIRDITERKRTEDERAQLEKQHRQLQKNESLGRMAGAIAHHFNNQLQAVMLSLEVAATQIPRDLQPIDPLAQAMQSARKAAEVSTQMLTYLGQSHGKQEPVDLAAICQSGLDLLRVALPRGVILEQNLPANGPTICANANQVQQILTNLITNAREASNDKPNPICVRVHAVTAAEIPASRRFPVDFDPAAARYACLEVADGGCGIAPTNVEKLFDPFYSTKFTGRGLGLAVVLGIARTHGGVITVESELGRGSLFRVFFPQLEEAPALRTPKPAIPPPSAGANGTVLVVEDEFAVRAGVTFALRRRGFAVFNAEDGVAALAVFRQHQGAIDCVLCDVTMPRLGGWETLHALRQLAPGIPVILASGYNEAQVMEGSHAEMPQAFLQKPYELETLIRTLVQLIATRAK